MCGIAESEASWGTEIRTVEMRPCWSSEDSFAPFFVVYERLQLSYRGVD
jgi:hypothetical protein